MTQEDLPPAPACHLPPFKAGNKAESRSSTCRTPGCMPCAANFRPPVPPQTLLWLWDRALSADAVLAGLDEPDPRRHPLAITVPDRTLTELIAGRCPASRPANSPVSPLPSPLEMGAGRCHRRPARYRRSVRSRRRAGGDAAPASKVPPCSSLRPDGTPVGGRRGKERPARRRRLDTWTPRWPLARSAAVTAAATGNLDPLHRFIDTGLASDQLQSANLNYWAYWAGEIPVPWLATAR